MSYQSPSGRRERAEFRKWTAGFVVFFGFPLYVTGYFSGDWRSALLVHFALVGLYLFLLLLFGCGSVVEMGVAVAMFSVVASLLILVFKREQMNKIRHQSTINRNANHR